MLFNISGNNISFGSVSSGKWNKSKNKCDYIKLKKFWIAKETRNKTKSPPTEWEMFANNITDKELISKIYKELIQLNINTETQTT